MSDQAPRPGGTAGRDAADGEAPDDGDRARTRARRQLVVAVGGCAVGAGLALFATSRTWAMIEGYRPVPFGPLGIEQSGTDLVPVVPALSLVAMAGAGAILATRGRGRMVVGVLIILTGLAMLGFLRPALDHSDVNLVWPALVVMAGLLIAGVGILTLRVGARWPAMGARYDRGGPAAGDTPTQSSAPPFDDQERNGRTQEASRAGEDGADPAVRQDTAWWDAIDRGEDPTTRG